MNRKAVQRILCLFIVFYTVLSGLSARERAEIVYAEGGGFTLVRQGESNFHDLYEEAAEGMILQAGDVILTEQETWIEIEINRSGSLIKIAENTTFSINSLENRGGSFGVSYGRVRAKVEKLGNDSPFWIQGVDTVAGVRGTDFGYDLFFDRKSPEKTRTDVYCFEGKVEVVKIVPETAGTEEPLSSLTLGRNEMVTVFSDSSEELKKERVTLALESFWAENDFIYEEEPLDVPDGTEVFLDSSGQLKEASLYSALAGSLISGMAAGSYYFADNSTGSAIGLGSVGGFMLFSAATLYIRALILESRSVSPPATE